MSERPAFTYALAAVVGFIKDEEDVAFALYRIAYRSEPITDPSPASKPRAFNISLKTLLSQIKSDADADLAALRISEKLETLPTSSVTSQQSGSSQQAISSSPPSSSPSSPSFSAEVNTSVLPAKAEPPAPVESDVPEPSSTDSAVSTTAHSEQSSASTEDTTPPPSTEATLAAPIESEVSQPSTTTAPDADIPRSQKPSASAQDTISPPSAETKSAALSAPGVTFSPSFMISALGDTTKSQRPSASASNATTPPSIEAESPAPAQSDPVTSSSTILGLHNTTQPQQTSASAANPQPPPAQPKKPLCSADQLGSQPYGLDPTYTPTDGASLPPEIAESVGRYQPPSYVVLAKLAEHGGTNYQPPGSENGVPLFTRLNYLDYWQNERSMVVQRDKFKDHNGMSIDIPRVSCNQYLDLYNSMIHRNPSNLRTICREILDELEVAIVNRTAVYKWYESLPPADGRVAYNPRHLAFLQMLERLERAINYYLHTGNTQLIRR
jgi:hypothetical protein